MAFAGYMLFGGLRLFRAGTAEAVDPETGPGVRRGVIRSG